ncbi:MAG: hypothetical protein NTV34_19860 [Proteobacteria bacterium]|nr:hypothetical protein [Pseudomonadota bacterium]
MNTRFSKASDFSYDTNFLKSGDIWSCLDEAEITPNTRESWGTWGAPFMIQFNRNKIDTPDVWELNRVSQGVRNVTKARIHPQFGMTNFPDNESTQIPDLDRIGIATLDNVGYINHYRYISNLGPVSLLIETLRPISRGFMPELETKMGRPLLKEGDKKKFYATGYAICKKQ